MIESAEEFVALRTSEIRADYTRAAHDTAPIAIWHDIITRYPEMKGWVAYNKTVPLSILRILANDPDPKVRFWVAMKRKLDLPLFEQLAQDPDESVRERIACNSKTPLYILKRLAQGDTPFVAEAAQERIRARTKSE